MLLATIFPTTIEPEIDVAMDEDVNDHDWRDGVGDSSSALGGSQEHLLLHGTRRFYHCCKRCQLLK